MHGAAHVAASAALMPCFLATQIPTGIPAISPPGIPSPPSQIFGIVAEVVVEAVPVGDDVVEAGADDTGENRPQPDLAGDLALGKAPRLDPAAEQPHRGDDAEGDHQAVGVERQRSDVQ